jgi:hypothetical protein
VSQTKVAITLEEGALAKVERWERGRLAEECARMNPVFERAMADEGLLEVHGSRSARFARYRQSASAKR